MTHVDSGVTRFHKTKLRFMLSLTSCSVPEPPPTKVEHKNQVGIVSQSPKQMTKSSGAMMLSILKKLAKCRAKQKYFRKEAAALKRSGVKLACANLSGNQKACRNSTMCRDTSTEYVKLLEEKLNAVEGELHMLGMSGKEMTLEIQTVKKKVRQLQSESSRIVDKQRIFDIGVKQKESIAELKASHSSNKPGIVLEDKTIILHKGSPTNIIVKPFAETDFDNRFNQKFDKKQNKFNFGCSSQVRKKTDASDFSKLQYHPNAGILPSHDEHGFRQISVVHPECGADVENNHNPFIGQSNTGTEANDRALTPYGHELFEEIGLHLPILHDQQAACWTEAYIEDEDNPVRIFLNEESEVDMVLDEFSKEGHKNSITDLDNIFPL